MTTWYDYRTAWSKSPWLVAVAVLGVALVAVGVIGTARSDILEIAFIPGLLALFGHHLLAMRRT